MKESSNPDQSRLKPDSIVILKGIIEIKEAARCDVKLCSVPLCSLKHGV